MSEEALIDAIMRIRVSQPGLTAAETHKALVDEGNADLELSVVKKAAGKATKRAAKEAAAPPPPRQKKVDVPSAPNEAKQAKHAKALVRCDHARTGIFAARCLH